MHSLCRYKREALIDICKAAEDNVEAVATLLDENSNMVENKSATGHTALHYAAQSGHSEIVKLLLERTANINAVTDEYSTALHLASEEGELDVVKLLIDGKVDVNAQDLDGRTALHKACECSEHDDNCFQVAHMLITDGKADTQIKCHSEETANMLIMANLNNLIPHVQKRFEFSYPSQLSFTIGVKLDAVAPVAEPTGTPLIFSIEPALPAGLTFDAHSGAIGGIASFHDDLMKRLSTEHTVTASNSGGSSTAKATVAVQHAAPTGLEVQDLKLNVGTAVHAQAVVVPKGCNVIFSIIGGEGLPVGLSLDEKTGIISGTPTSTAVCPPVTIQAANSGGPPVTKSFQVVVMDAPPAGIKYPAEILFTIGVKRDAVAPVAEPTGTPLIFSIEPALPAGLTFDAHSGAIGGIASFHDDLMKRLSTEHTVTASNSGGSSTAKATVAVQHAAPTGLEVQDLKLNVGTAVHAQAVVVPKGCNVIFSIIGGEGLPVGLSLDEKTGIISGTPTSTAVCPPVTIQAANSGGPPVTKSFQVVVMDAPPAGIKYPAEILFTIGVKRDAVAPVAEPTGTPLIFSIEPALPAGLTFDAHSGAIGGIASFHDDLMKRLSTEHTVTASNSGGSSTAKATVAVQHAAPTGLEVQDLKLNVGTAVHAQAVVVPKGCNVVFSIIGGEGLPVGLSLDEKTGIISGTPTSTAVCPPVTIQAANSGGPAMKKSFQVVVMDAPPAGIKYLAEILFTIGVKRDAVAPVAEPTGTPLIFSIEPALPAGLTFDAHSGAIGGIASFHDDLMKRLSTEHTVTASNSGGSSTAKATVAVQHAAPTGLEVQDLKLNVGTAVHAQAVVVPKGCNVIFSIIGGEGLPVGLSLDEKTGIISGTPTSTAVCPPVTIQAANSGGPAMKKSFQVVVMDAPPAGIKYPAEILFTIGVKRDAVAPVAEPTGTPLIFSIEPALPAGLTFDAHSGAIGGIASFHDDLMKRLSTEHTVTASNSGGSSTAKATVAVQHAAPTGLEVQDLKLNVGTAVHAQAVVVPKGCNVVFSIIGGEGLPVGLSLDEKTGIISGTPTSTAVCPPVTIQAANSGGPAMKKSFQVVVMDAPPAGIKYLAEILFTIGVKRDAVAPVAEPTGTPLIFSIEPALPAGLTFDAHSGAIGGIASFHDDLMKRLSTEHTVTASNSGGSSTAKATVAVQHAAPTGLEVQDLKLNVGTAVHAQAVVVPKGCNVIFSIIGGEGLPVGLSLDEKTGIISGTPTSTAVCPPVTIQAANSGGPAMKKSFQVVVMDAPPAGIKYPAEILFTIGVKRDAVAPVAEPTGTPLIFSIEPALPAGLTFDAHSGAIGGIASFHDDLMKRLSTEHTVTASNSGGSSTAKATVAVQHAAPTGLEVQDLKLNVGTAVHAQAVVVPKGCNVVFSIIGGEGLPVGLSLDEKTGIISGTPTSTAVCPPVTIQAANSGGPPVTKRIQVHVNEVKPRFPLDLPPHYVLCISNFRW